MQPIIENKPIPPLKRRGATAKYPWTQMQPGDAFKFDESATMAGAYSLAYKTGKQHRMKFAVRQTAEGLWCWRIDGTPYDTTPGAYVPIVSDFAKTITGPPLETYVTSDVD